MHKVVPNYMQTLYANYMDCLNNEGSMVQTCQKINVHVINTDICCDLHEC